MTFYCVKCREKKDIADAEVERGTAKNGRPFVRAVCPSCGTKMFKFVSAND
jgi:predicted  nucleic acid-binding Zn-ribbon protein